MIPANTRKISLTICSNTDHSSQADQEPKPLKTNIIMIKFASKIRKRKRGQPG